MQLPRMTTRRWMVAVALFGVTMSVVVAIRAGWNYFLALRRIQYHTGMEATWRWLDPLGRDEKQAIDQALGIIDEQRQITGDFSLDEDFKSAMVEYLRILTPPHHKQEYHAAMAQISARHRASPGSRSTPIRQSPRHNEDLALQPRDGHHDDARRRTAHNR